MGMRRRKRVFVSGCYDMLHSGHIAFFKEASSYGRLYVGIGSDTTIEELKGRKPICCERERLYSVKAVRYVEDACINTGSGFIDFEESVDRFNPDIFVVNEDGHSEVKAEFCRKKGIEYVVLKRIPDEGLEIRSTTSIRNNVTCQLPYRLDIAGTWIDQPYVSKYYPGWAITISLEPTIEFMERCGMSTSTRNAAREIWPYHFPDADAGLLAKLLFCYENEPGKKGPVSGAQDAIGICMPGLCRHYYDKRYWPEKIENCNDEKILKWLEEHICLVLLWPRRKDLSVVEGMDITTEKVKALSDAAKGCWEAIMNRDLRSFAKFYKASFEAQTSMFPGMLSDGVAEAIEKYKDKVLAWKLAGAGGGGYLALLCEEPVDGSIRIKIRRKGL